MVVDAPRQPLVVNIAYRKKMESVFFRGVEPWGDNGLAV